MALEEAVPCLAAQSRAGGSGTVQRDPPHGTATDPSTGPQCRAAGASSTRGTGQTGPAPGSLCHGVPRNTRGPRLGGDALPKAQHSPGHRDGAASPTVQRRFYKKWHSD